MRHMAVLQKKDLHAKMAMPLRLANVDRDNIQASRHRSKA